jgi:hypothetical protein
MPARYTEARSALANSAAIFATPRNVEGHEMSVLRGASGTLRKYLPPMRRPARARSVRICHGGSTARPAFTEIQQLISC